MDSAGDAGMDELCSRFAGLRHYADMLQEFVTAIESEET